MPTIVDNQTGWGKGIVRVVDERYKESICTRIHTLSFHRILTMDVVSVKNGMVKGKIFP
jgi:hypothetical protein